MLAVYKKNSLAANPFLDLWAVTSKPTKLDTKTIQSSEMVSLKTWPAFQIAELFLSSGHRHADYWPCNPLHAHHRSAEMWSIVLQQKLWTSDDYDDYDDKDMAEVQSWVLSFSDMNYKPS